MTVRSARVVCREEAVADLRGLAQRAPATLIEVFRLLRSLHAGGVSSVPLHDYAQTGDLADYAKIVVAVEGEPAHRIVVRDRGGGAFEVIELSAVEDRIGDLPHLLAGLRMARLEEPDRRSDAQRRVERIRRLRNP